MLPPQDISVFLNNALRATHMLVQIDGETPLPEVVHDMPDRISGRFVDLAGDAAREIAEARKKIMYVNTTQVLYTFTFDAESCTFQAQKR